MPIDPYAALNAMVRAEVARSSERPVAEQSPSRERHEPEHSDAGGEEEDPAVSSRP